MPIKANYEIKTIPESSLEQAVNLWQLAFGPPYDIYEAMKYAKEQLSSLIGAFTDDNVLVATAGIIDFQIKMNGNWLPCGGIAAVATSPEHRRKNIVNQLLIQCLENLKARQIPISTLWPFSYSFYEHVGWSVTNWQYQIEAELPGLHKLGESRNYKNIDLENYNSLADIHDSWCDLWNLSLKRNNKRWERLVFRRDSITRLFAHKDGYMLVDLGNSKDGLLSVKEWVYTNNKAFTDGLALLGQWDSQFKKATWLGGSVEHLTDLGIFDQIKIQMKPGMMSRVVNKEALSESLNMSTKLAIQDPLGISGNKDNGDIGSGEIIQVLTNFNPELTKIYEHLIKGQGIQKAFSIEKY